MFVNVQISVVSAPPQLLQAADELLNASIRCPAELRKDIRAVAKAYIDEDDEVRRAIQDIQAGGRRAQLDTRSPEHMRDKARKLKIAVLANGEQQKKIREVAESYLFLAEKNDENYEKFKQQLRDQTPPPKG
jgi:hypothetical protein